MDPVSPMRTPEPVHPPPASLPPSASPSRTSLWIAVAIAVLLIFAAAVYISRHPGNIARSTPTGEWSHLVLPTDKTQPLWNNNGVVYQGKSPVVPSVDIATFESYNYPQGYDGIGLRRDKTSVWINIDKWEVLAGADPATIEPLYPPYPAKQTNNYIRYAKDATHVWYLVGNDPQPIDGADAATFVAISPYPDDYAKDAAHAYYNGKMIAGADAATFVVLNSNGILTYAKDKSHVYYGDKVLSGAYVATFKPVVYADGYEGETYGTDAQHVWTDSSVLPNADSKTFVPVYGPALAGTELWVNYVKDGTHVWYDNIPDLQVIPDADAATFIVLSSGQHGFAKDKSHVYVGGALLAGADPTFIILNSTYEKDATHVYANGDVIPGADVATFTVNGDAASASDKNHTYSGGERTDYKVGDVINGFTVTSVSYAQNDPTYLNDVTFAGTATVQGHYNNLTQDMCQGPYFFLSDSDQGKLPDGIGGFEFKNYDATIQALAPYDNKDVTITISGMDESRYGKDCEAPRTTFLQVAQ